MKLGMIAARMVKCSLGGHYLQTHVLDILQTKYEISILSVLQEDISKSMLLMFFVSRGHYSFS